MKTIENKIISGLTNWETANLSQRDRVEAGTYRLWGYTVARIIDDKLVLSDCGWNTATTASRINAFLSAYRAVHNGLPVRYKFGNKAGYYCGKTKLADPSVSVSVNLLDGEFTN